MTLYYILVVLLALLAAASGVLSLAVALRDSRRFNRTLDRINARIARH